MPHEQADDRTQRRSSPSTDPTNPRAQESVGHFAPAERTNENARSEPGLTDRDRDGRDHARKP